MGNEIDKICCGNNKIDTIIKIRGCIEKKSEQSKDKPEYITKLEAINDALGLLIPEGSYHSGLEDKILFNKRIKNVKELFDNSKYKEGIFKKYDANRLNVYNKELKKVLNILDQKKYN